MEIVGPISKQSAEHNPELCQVCQVTKAHRQISRRATGQTYGPYGRVHFDLIHINEGYNGDRWITHFYIDGMRFHAAYTHESKNGVQFAVKDFLPYARHVLGIPLKAVKFDNERSVSHDVERIIRENGFVIEHSVRAAPEQNGHAERSGGWSYREQDHCSRMQAYQRICGLKLSEQQSISSTDRPRMWLDDGSSHGKK